MHSIKTSILLLLLFPSIVFCQKKNEDWFKLNISVKNSIFSYAILSYQDLANETERDTINLIDKDFFSNTNFEPGLANLKLIGKDTSISYSFYLDTGYQTIIRDNNKNIRISGSTINTQYDSLCIDNVLDTTKALNFIRNYPNKTLSPHLIYILIWQKKIGVKSAYELYNLVTCNKSSRICKILSNELRLRMYPKQAPNFKINQNLSLTDLKGKYVLLDFWASWCVPCRNEIPKLKILKSRYNNLLEIVLISIDEDSTAWQKAIVNDKVQDWFNLMRDNNIKRDYFNNVEHPIPLVFLINPDGVIIWNSFESDRDELAQILSKSVGF